MSRLDNLGLPALLVFENPKPEDEYTIQADMPDFTSICPVTEGSNTGQVVVRYVPGLHCLELHSFCELLRAFSSICVWEEETINFIFSKLMDALMPKGLSVRMTYYDVTYCTTFKFSKGFGLLLGEMYDS